MKTVYLCSQHPIPWWRQFPGENTVWGNYRFIFEDPGKPYDYLVVWDRPLLLVKRRCPGRNTIHVNTEPNEVQRYEKGFLDQFARCLTIDPEINHPAAVYTQPGLNWYLGWKPGTDTRQDAVGWRELRGLFDEPRTKLISVIASNKSPLHEKKRFTFANALKGHLGDRIDFFGRGWREMDDKLEALRGYRFHVALENSSYPHYFSEKLSDPFIAGCQPIYWGCPNVADYFPEEALILIDIDDIHGSIRRIEQAICADEDKQRLDARRVARDMVFYEHNIFALLARQIDDMESMTRKIEPPAKTLLSKTGWISRNNESVRVVGLYTMGNLLKDWPALLKLAHLLYRTLLRVLTVCGRTRKG